MSNNQPSRRFAVSLLMVIAVIFVYIIPTVAYVKFGDLRLTLCLLAAGILFFTINTVRVLQEEVEVAELVEVEEAELVEEEERVYRVTVENPGGPPTQTTIQDIIKAQEKLNVPRKKLRRRAMRIPQQAVTVQPMELDPEMLVVWQQMYGEW